MPTLTEFSTCRSAKGWVHQSDGEGFPLFLNISRGRYINSALNLIPDASRVEQIVKESGVRAIEVHGNHIALEFNCFDDKVFHPF